MKPETLILMSALWAASLGAVAPLPLGAPEGVTLSVDSSEAGTISWEPVDRDDLMGYSIWMRADKGEFTRLNIPTLVGKELKKLPMTTKSSMTLKGLGRRDLELTVICEYESGRSPSSKSVYSKKARRSVVQATGSTTPTGAAEVSEAPAPTANATPEPTEIPDKPALTVPMRPVMAPQGKVQTSVGIGVSLEQTVAKGYNSMNELGFIVDVDGLDYSKAENWTTTFSRRHISIPLSLEYGFLSQLEIGGEVAYVQERTYMAKYDFGPYTLSSGSSYETVEASGFSNPTAKVRLQPSASQPLRLSARLNVSTGGRSRLQSYGEYLLGTSHLAGLDDNDNRLTLALDYGEGKKEGGLIFGLSLAPAGSEGARAVDSTGTVYTHRADRGQELAGRVGYAFLWNDVAYPGEASVGICLRSIDPGRWTINGVESGNSGFGEARAQLRAFTGVNLVREDQTELFLDFRQNLYSDSNARGVVSHVVDAKGKISFVIKPDGWIFGASGGFYY